MFGQIGARFDHMEQRFSGVDRRFDQLERKVDQRFSEVETVTNALVDAVADINRKLNESS